MTTVPLLTLWEITPPGRTVLRLTSSPPVQPEQVPFPQRGVWVGGVAYWCAGIDMAGEERASGRVPSTQMRVALNGYLQERTDSFSSDTVVTRVQTDARAADASNWADGVNPWAATPSQVNHRVDRWVIIRADQETGEILQVEMRKESEFWADLVRPVVPGRCYHRYRGTACGYTGTKYWDVEGKPVTNAGEDICGLSISDCELRFPAGALPYGGLPLIREGEV